MTNTFESPTDDPQFNMAEQVAISAIAFPQGRNFIDTTAKR